MTSATLTTAAQPAHRGAASDLDGSQERRRHLSALDGYRGLAALAVVVYHAYQFAAVGTPGLLTSVPGAYAAVHSLDGAVDLFFVLSAFLLTVPFAKAVLHGRPGPSTRAYAWRRAARILPLYLIAILTVWAWRNPVLPGDLKDLLAHLTFTQIYDDERIFWTIGPAWSLAVEIHFYVALAVFGAAITAVALRIAPRFRLPLLVSSIAALFVGSVLFKAVAWYALDVPGDRWSVWFSLPAKLDTFALGMLLATIYVATSRRLTSWAATLLRWSGVAIVVLAVATRPPAPEHLWFHTIAAAGFIAILASSVLGPGGKTERALDSAVPATLGLVSYSLYIWHEPLLLWLADNGIVPAGSDPGAFLPTLLVLVPAAIALAWISYHVIEVPGNQLGKLVDSKGRSRRYYDEAPTASGPDTQFRATTSPGRVASAAPA